VLDQPPIDTVYLCDWLPPNFGAVGQYSLLFARDLMVQGQKVILVGLTSTDTRIERECPESNGELTIVRLAARPQNRSSNLQRMLWAIRTNSLLLRGAWTHIRRARRVLFTGSPPFFLHWIMLARLIHGRPVTYRITDFHPECAIAERGSATLLLRAILALTYFWRRRVDQFEVLGHDQAHRLHEIGINPERILLKPDPSPVVIRQNETPMPRPEDFNGRVLLLYSGNWGVAHDVETFVDGYTCHYRHGLGRVVLWLNAIGNNADRVEFLLRERGLPLHRTQPVPIESLPRLLVTPDAHLITLSDAFVGYVLPSKVHGCVASGKPTLFIGSHKSDVHRICTEGLGALFACRRRRR